MKTEELLRKTEERFEERFQKLEKGLVRQKYPTALK